MLAVSSLGFLGYNWPPARIFMGDVGSAFLGYSFAAVTLLGAQVHPRLALVGLLLLWPFVFDTLFTMVRRWRRGENIFQAHRSHLYQRLVIVGYSHRMVTLLYASLSLAGGVAAMLWFYAPLVGRWFIIIGMPLLLMLLVTAVSRYEARQTPHRYPVESRLVVDEP
jgi:UDP-N-acetylmuramyl pentapeptide phosphotransferase/UDP-N-acetylglucosamine-1-phosphate transferase